MDTPIVRAALTKAQLGSHVERATADIFTGGTVALFNVRGGRVLLNLIVGEVTTIHEGAGDTVKLQGNPTTGSTNDICAAVEMNGAEVGTLYAITGTVGDAAILGKSGAVKAQVAPVVVAAGAIESVSSANRTGSMKWDLWYIPLDEGAYVEAA